MSSVPDPRLSSYLRTLPQYSAVLDYAVDQAPHDERARRLLEPHVYLGLKLGDSQCWLEHITRAARRLGHAIDTGDLTNGRRPASAYRFRILSAQVDAFLCATYGALDALSRVIAAAHSFVPDEEVTFLSIERVLQTGCTHAHGCRVLRAELVVTYEARWFSDLRRLRSLVNFRSVLATSATGRTAEAFCIGEPDQQLGGLRALSTFCASTYEQVVGTVETLLRIMEDHGLFS